MSFPISPPLVDEFTPYDQACRAEHDQDLGSGSPLSVPGHGEMILSSKTGAVHVLDQTSLGGYADSRQSGQNRQAKPTTASASGPAPTPIPTPAPTS